jgi:diguanylate cyclase (GGDEF)-like protein/PAS domain S-box-containing protein
LPRIVAAEERQLRAKPIKRDERTLDESSIAALARAASESHEVVERDLRAEIATLKADALRYRAAGGERFSLQALIDQLPDYLWVKDTESRFVVVNKALAAASGRAKTSDMIGLTDFDIHAPETAQEFRAIEREIVVSGEPIIDKEELMVDAAGTKKWHSSTKVPLRNERNEIIGLVGVARDITELKATRAVANERLSLQALIDRLPDNLWVKDVESRFVISNQVTATRMGFAGPGDLMGKTDLELLPHKFAQKFFADEQEIVRTGQPMIDMEEYYFNTWISTTKVPLRNDRGEIFGVAGVSRDITERKLADALRDGQGQILEMIAMSAPLEDVLDRLVRLVESQLTGIFGAILLVDEDGTRLRNGAAPNLPEAYVKAIDGAPIGPNAGPSGRAAYRREPVIVADAQTDPLLTDYKDLAAANGLRSCWSTPILSHDGEARGVFAMYSRSACEPSPVEMRLVDIATHMAGIAIERKLAEDRIQFMANHDALTGLPNRTLLDDRLSQALLYAQRYDRWATVAFVDLDNFKNINDSLGHNAGDELLKTVASRMVACVRATDTVARLGGDEFVILLFDQPKSADIISAAVRKIRAAIAEPICLEGHDLRVTSSMGIANYPDDGTDAETLLASADAAMYRAKEMGRDNFQFYTPELNAKVHEKFLLHEEMRNAVARSEFVLVYQPQVDLRTGRIFAVEALIRWKHPTLGVLSPIKFIPMAEETGLIVPIGDWVLHEACRQNKAWQDGGLPPMTVCVNVSARQFRDKSLSSRVVSALQDSGLDAKYLELEMTESMIMLDVELAVTTMKELQELGVHLSIDDFGTGYSSLSALKNFPVSRLKIDKTFINDLTTNDNDTAVASAVISLGQKLKMRVIAEGVETDDQLAFLRENNCDEMQGYHFSRPIPAQEIEKLLKTQAQPDQSASR